MLHFNFEIPSRRDELLRDSDAYCVKNVFVLKELQNKMKEAKQGFRDDGPEYILDHFDLYYSILHHEASIPMDIVFRSYQDLQIASTQLNKSIDFLLEDRGSITYDLKQKFQNVIKMLLYIYMETILVIEKKNVTSIKNQGMLKSRKKSDNQPTFNLNKKLVLLTLNNLIQKEISLFWDPPVVEENFMNMIAEVCYTFLQNPSIKTETDARVEVFNLIGTLITTYHHSTTFAIRMAQMIKDEEHLVTCLSDGVKQLVDHHKCLGLIHALVREITEWQTDEKFQDSQGSRFCGQFLTALATAMPNLMYPEILYLNKYLSFESATLRNSVLNVITEIISKVLTKHTLNKEDSENRDELLSVLFEHIADNSALVRSRVLQHWARLQQETAIPKYMVIEVLRDIIENHLHEKAAIVRKSAINCANTFLGYNAYGAMLSLKQMQQDLEAHEKKLNELKPKMDQMQSELETQWEKTVPALRKFLLTELQKAGKLTDQQTNIPLDKGSSSDLVKMYLSEGKYKEAFIIWKSSAEFDDEDEESDEEEIMDAFLEHFKMVYMGGLKILDDVIKEITPGNFVITEEDINQYVLLKERVEYLSGAVDFLKLMETAVEKAIDLLETTCISDMQEAVAFIISAYKFKIDNAQKGIMAMLRIMKRNEQDRKDMIIEAFKTIYLKTETSDMQEHTATIVNRLMHLRKNVLYVNLDDLEVIISEWVRKGIIDNSVINTLWQNFTQKIPVSDEDSHICLDLLRMAALSRKTIVTLNIKLVTSKVFSEMGRKDLPLLGTACKFLALIGRDRIDINSPDPAFKIGPDDQIFKDLFNILYDTFFEPDEFYHHALSGAINFVYKTCGKPFEFCESFIKQIVEKLPDEGSISRFVYIRLCQLLGIVAVQHLDYLDETVYKELKRRENIMNNKGKDKSKKKPRNKNVNSSFLSDSSTIMEGSSVVNSTDESNLEGAQAEDEEAEFILRVLERNTVTGSGLLAQLAPIIINICEKPQTYDDVDLQGAATIALIRYMIVSSEFCNKHIQLLFTIFEKTKYSSIKESILFHLSDLLTRFPNIIEPWTSRIYERLKDPLVEIRTTTFYTLSSLILRDMIRAHSYIHLMVNSLIDPDPELSSMCRMFFITLAQKENNLYNVLPDIFSHLMDSQDITEENSRDIMKFLFELMDKSKQMENLVDRFCSKFETTEDLRSQRNIAYCLSLIVYNERAIKKLHENFSMYKHLVHDPEIYTSFKTIMQAASKQQVGRPDLKPVVAELEKCISSVFELNPEAQMMRPPPIPKSTKKRIGSASKTSGKSRRKKLRAAVDDSDSE